MGGNTACETAAREAADRGSCEWTAKPWGRTRTLYFDNRLWVVEAVINAGEKSSWHWHERMENRFIVLEGILEVWVSEDKGRSKRPAMLGVRNTAISAGVVHQFEAITGVRLLEVYLPVNLKGGGRLVLPDIQRVGEVVG